MPQGCGILGSGLASETLSLSHIQMEEPLVRRTSATVKVSVAFFGCTG